MDLFDPHGRRLYVTSDERDAFLTAAAKAPRQVRSLCLTLHALYRMPGVGGVGAHPKAG